MHKFLTTLNSALASRSKFLQISRQFLHNKMSELDPYGRPYPSRQGGYLVPSLAADNVIFRNKEGKLQVLLVTRGHDPYAGRLAFPGGFVEYNEDPKHACIRELKEECNIEGVEPKLLTISGDPARDPRGHVVSIIYRVTVSEDAQPVGGDDAAHADFYNVDELLADPARLAFDHHQILKYAVETYKD